MREVPNPEIREKLLEAERHVDRLAQQPKSLAVLQEALEAVAGAKGVPLTISAGPSLHVKKHVRYGTEYSIVIKDDAFHVGYMYLADMGTTIFSTLQEATWYIVTGSSATPSFISSLYSRARRKLEREGKTPGRNGFISFKYMSSLTDDDK